MTTPHYVIRGGPEGRERLRVLARVMAPMVALAGLAPEGSVVGIDVDEAKIDLGSQPAVEPPSRATAGS
jgi:hypothetical protein